MELHSKVVALACSVVALAACSKPSPSASTTTATSATSVTTANAAPSASLWELSAKGIDGKDVALSTYKGKVVLAVNVASECGYTPQYEGLEKLYEKYKDKGFFVLGFPSNEFGGQEPGSNSEIATFCKSKYGVTFPMFAKIETKGANASPVYKLLTANHGEPKWNFHKYLVGKDGRVRMAYPSKVKPDDAELTKAIDVALAE
jgi:glutathione peroxidase